MSSPPQSLEAALAALYARIPAGMKLGLAAMEEACASFGHPERAFEAVHVAGTNGKGSVSAMVAAILRASGKRVGLTTSPHLCRFAERIQIDGEPIDDDALLRVLGEALDEAPSLTFFETATLAAFLAFRDAKVDVAVVEVGLGGRLDATNVLPRPRAAAVTRIAFDHMDRLGGALVDIAREKAGIAKPGLDLVLGPMSADVRNAIDEVAHARGATTSSAADDEQATRFLATASIGLLGAHQRENARIAYVLGRRMGADAKACAKGIASVRWPGRLERIDTEHGPVLLDAAHNPDGIESLCAYLASVPGRKAVVFGALSDKAWQEMQDTLATAIPRRFYVRPETLSRPAVAPETLAARHAGVVCRSVAEAIAKARVAVGEEGLVVVAGSILLVGEARALLLGLPRDPPVGM